MKPYASGLDETTSCGKAKQNPKEQEAKRPDDRQKIIKKPYNFGEPPKMTPETEILKTKLQILGEFGIGLALIFGLLKLYFMTQDPETKKKAGPYFLYGRFFCIAAMICFALFLFG